MNRKPEWIARERVVNWLALIVLLSLGIVWPPAFSQEAADGLANAHADALQLKADRMGTASSRLSAIRIPRSTLLTRYPFNAIQPGGPLRFVVTAD